MSKFSPKAPSTSRHHADWLSLVEVSGPFVSLPVLLRVFPQGLDARDPVQAKSLRAAYEEWQDNPTAPGKQRAWVLHVLTAVLGYPINQITEGQTLPTGLEANMPEMGETLRPDFALVGPAGNDTAGHAKLLIASYPAEQKLDKPTIGKYWKATPATRMMELLHGAGVQLGLVTNGEHWMLVYAPRGETTGYASWYGSLWLDEPITLRAFHSLLGVHRFFGVATDGIFSRHLRACASAPPTPCAQNTAQTPLVGEFRVLAATLANFRQKLLVSVATGIWTDRCWSTPSLLVAQRFLIERNAGRLHHCR